MADSKPSILTAEKILSQIRSGNARWLAFVFALLINDGHKLRAQFAFCPSSSPDKVEAAYKKMNERGEKNDQTIKDTS
jgi:hypothetical protein